MLKYRTKLNEGVLVVVDPNDPLPCKLTTEGVVMLPGELQKVIPWEQYAKVRVKEDLAVLITDRGSYVGLHRRFFKNPEEFDAALIYARHQIRETL